MNDQNLNLTEAIQALKDGKKLTHQYFSDDEWVVQHPDKPSYFLFKDGVTCHSGLFWADRLGIGWETGWSVVNDLADITND